MQGHVYTDEHNTGLIVARLYFSRFLRAPIQLDSKLEHQNVVQNVRKMGEQPDEEATQKIKAGRKNYRTKCSSFLLKGAAVRSNFVLSMGSTCSASLRSAHQVLGVPQP